MEDTPKCFLPSPTPQSKFKMPVHVGRRGLAMAGGGRHTQKPQFGRPGRETSLEASVRHGQNARTLVCHEARL